MRKYSVIIMLLAAVGAGCGKTIVTVPAEVDAGANAGADSGADSGAGGATDANSSADAAADANSGSTDAPDSSTNPDVLVAIDGGDVQDNPIEVAADTDSGPPKCGSAADCDDKNACTEDKCDGASGKCSNPAKLEGIPCDDSDACTTGEKCDGKGGCIAKGQALWITNKIGATALSEGFNDVAVGADGTIVAVGSAYTSVTPGKEEIIATIVGLGADQSDKYFEKPKQAGSHSTLRRVVKTASGDFLAVGVSNSGLDDERVYTIQVNANGKIVKEDNNGVLPSAATVAADGRDVAARKAGGAVVVGARKEGDPPWQFPHKAFIKEINAAGNYEGIAKVYDTPSPFAGFADQYFDAVAEAPAGGYWVGAHVYGNEIGSVARLLRIQANGSEINAQLFASMKVGNYQAISRLIADTDGVTIFGSGSYGPYGGSSDAWAARVGNNNDKILWLHWFGGPGGDGFNAAAVAPNGGYFVAGYSTLTGDKPSTQNLIGLISQSGLLVWQKNIKDITSSWSAIATTKTGVVVAGATN